MKPQLKGTSPCARSGHSLSVVGLKAYMFGGCGRQDGASGPSTLGDLHVLDISNPDLLTWSQAEATSTVPPARSRHTASVWASAKKIVLFGGLDRKTRFADLWTYDTSARAWVEIVTEGEAPPPRAHHCATMVGSTLYVFGGYGGNGKVYSDIWSIDLAPEAPDEEGAPAPTWTCMQLKGKGPSPRFDASMTMYEIGAETTTKDDDFPKLCILGGRDNIQYYKDMFVLDLESASWDDQPHNKPPPFNYQISNQSSVAIESVPNWTLFNFGGKRDQMAFLDAVDVFNCGQMMWRNPAVLGEPPCPREDCAMAYDSKTCRLLVFGGWANRWLGDTWTLNVAPIIGPPYACMGVEPSLGPVGGDTEITVKGLSFKESSKIEVKFGMGKNEVTVPGTFVDVETITCQSPNYEAFGAMEVPVRVSIGGEGWTVNRVSFRYFANTQASNCMAYGPGLLGDGIIGVEMPFYILAKDTCDAKRTSGGEVFEIEVLHENFEENRIFGEARVVDPDTGLFYAYYSVPSEGKYNVHVKYNGEGIRGSPFPVTCKDPWTTHRVIGTAPISRKGLTFTTLAGGNAAIYGGNADGKVTVLETGGETDGSDWRWVDAAPDGDTPQPRSGHGVTAVGDRMVVFGGLSADGGSEELNDVAVFQYSKDGCRWTTAQQAAAEAVAEAPCPRQGQAVVHSSKKAIVLGGEGAEDLLGDAAILDLPTSESAWVTPEVSGDAPSARRDHAAVMLGQTLFVFGGATRDEEDEDVILGDLCVAAVDVRTGTIAWEKANVKGQAPCARKGASFQVVSATAVMLYGGKDAKGRPLNDAYVLDAEGMEWRAVYKAASELIPSTGMVAAVIGGSIVSLSAAAGATKLDVVKSLNVAEKAAEFDFIPVMSARAESDLEALEARVQNLKDGFAADYEAGGFGELLKVMECLFEVKTKRVEIELAIDVMSEVLVELRKDGRRVDAQEARVEAVREVWTEIKKQYPILKENVAPFQAAEGERIKLRLREFADRVFAYRTEEFLGRDPFKYEVGYAAAFAAIDAVKLEVDALDAEMAEQKALADTFDFSELLERSLALLAECHTDLVAVKDLWDVAMLCEVQFKDWESTLWSMVDTQLIDDGAKACDKEVRSLTKAIKGRDVFGGLQTYVKNFMVSIPLVADLRSPAMRDRHWQQLMETTGTSFNVNDPAFRLADLLALELHRFEEDVGEIVDRAQKEEKMDNTLNKIDETWARIEFSFSQHKDSNIQLAKLLDEDVEAMEDNQLAVQGMLANRYFATFEERILSWNRRLGTVYDVVQVLNEIQRQWAYLESLFIHSEEVKKELPEDAARFKGIDAEVKKILINAYETKNVVTVCCTEGLLAKLEDQQRLLEQCEKALAEYMEAKRRIFPRFYFVSTADLLDILSNGNTPVKVMPHLSKTFQAIDRLELQGGGGRSRPTAHGMHSCVGTEYVEFGSALRIEGKVEDYMNDIVAKMRGELRALLGAALEAYNNPKPRHEWLFDHPSQLCLVVTGIFWTQETEEAFSKMAAGDREAMKAYNEQQTRQLNDLIGLVQGKIDKVQRRKAMNMITMDAHARDMNANLVAQGTARPDEFAWQSQLRSYWEQDVKDCRIKICDASFPYGYEYLGNGGRLVITPLTDRIYITACQACWLSLGTAPAGPAGTGKTETTKDLSSQLGKSVYVFNCSPEMDYRSMGDIFKGLAASGSWGCFDEFNRLIPEVLSVCAVQYKAVIDAQRKKAALPGRGLVPGGETVDSFVASDGVVMKLEEGMSAFITMVRFPRAFARARALDPRDERVGVPPTLVTGRLTPRAHYTVHELAQNPGYIGRAELPESLKANFRPITVMVPDRQMIMENMLMAEGFVEARMLAKKFATLYYLLEDLLSPEKHYDWGLRAISSVLKVAGTLLRSEAGQVEADVLFRALRDFNIPKILNTDLVIFLGLLTDLFPGTDPPRKRDPAFEAVIKETATEMGLFPDDDFTLRVVQLSELLAIRHCVFLMGPTGVGRTEAYRVLAKAILKGTDEPADTYLASNNRKKVIIRDINPKSISTTELYGYVNQSTREWKDGMLSVTMRDLANIPDDDPKWILLDGDLDANWIESMNSVMDDNKLLTLPSNERIRLPPHMKLIFEIRDLKFATPATATRAGILYISEAKQWYAMMQSWLKRAVPAYTQTFAKVKNYNAAQPMEWLSALIDKYVPACIFEMKKSYKHITPLATMNWASTLVSVLESMLKPENLGAKADQPLFEMVFVFACVWAFGGALSTKDGVEYRRNFNKWFKSKFTTVKFPSKGTVFDYHINFKSGKFAPWGDLVTQVDFDSSSMEMSNVFVPTAETASLTFMLNSCLGMRKPIMFVGGAGCGKTQLVMGRLATLGDDMMSHVVSFNYFSDVISFQRSLEAPLEKKAGINYGPPGTKRAVYFVDDLNMPKLDKYETAMPISLIRQHLGWGHWFDRSKLTQKNINNTQYVAAMNPTAGSFVVNPRLQRLFATFAVEFPGLDSLLTIYGTFLNGHLKGFSPELQEFSNKLMQAALGLHNKVASTFRKTAVNFHYEFTVRHLAGVFQGLLMSDPANVGTLDKFSKLWLHESARTYADRLVDAKDLAAYNKAAEGVAKKFLNLDASEFHKAQDPAPLIFSHFAKGMGEGSYDMVESYSALQATLEGALAEYNETNAVMDLVLFEDALKHVCRIARIVSNTSGHALLVGVGGSGKQSLSKLAASVCGLSAVSIVISGSYGVTNLKEDLQVMYRRAGLKDEGIMFLLTDSQIVKEEFLVFVSDLLSSGDIPDLFATEDKDDIINAMRGEVKAAGKADTRENCWEHFIGKVKQNLHVVFTHSPVGDAFRTRAQRFPAIITKTVIDWFQPWPESSLLSVAKRFLQDVDLGDDATKDAVARFFPASFAAVNKASEQYLAQERRYNYTTPKSFLELLQLYIRMLGDKREKTQLAIDRLDNGLSKLNQTKKDVDVLIEQAQVKAVEVEEKVASSDVFAEKVGAEKVKVNAENDAAAIEAEKCAQIQVEVTAKQESCERDLAAAEPLVLKAEAALDTLNKKDIGETKSLAKPPAGVDDVLAAVLVLLSPPGALVKDRTWNAAKKAMSDPSRFMEQLKGFKGLIDTQQVDHKNFKAVRPYLELEHFTPEIIKGKSKAAAGLCDWAINIVMYYDVVCEVEPKRQELAAANAMLEEANTKLSAVQTKVAELNAQVAQLEDEFNMALKEKEDAIAESEHCQMKLDLANRLINALGSEGDRWAANTEQLRADYGVLIGDALLAAGFVGYAGCFTAQFRQSLTAEFNEFIVSNNVPMTQGQSVLKLLVDDATVAGWVSEGLPSDTTSVENGAIVTTSKRWPLMIDPQLQGIAWIKEREAKNNLHVVRMGAPKTVTVIERAIEAGESVLIENMEETIDAVLNTVVTRSVTKRGRSTYCKIGDKEVEYHPSFKLFLHTKMSSPHYGPEIQAETTLVNFTVTESGLEDQLLALVVNKERPDLEETKTNLIVSNNEYTIKLAELENGLLSKLASAEGDITEDVELIESLEESKRVSDEITNKVAEAKETEIRINEAREKYRSVAARGSLLFFLLNSLNAVHSFYQFSLNAFVTVYSRGIDNTADGKKRKVKLSFRTVAKRVMGKFDWNMDLLRALLPSRNKGGESSEAAGAPVEEPTPEMLEKRLSALIDTTTYTVFDYTRRGLFDKDKLIFSSMLVFKVLLKSGQLDPEEYSALITGARSVAPPPVTDELSGWLADTQWAAVDALTHLKALKGLAKDMEKFSDRWKSWCAIPLCEAAPLPGEWGKKTLFQQLLVMRALRPDRVTAALAIFVEKTMGATYTNQPPFRAEQMIEETGPSTPIFFVLFPGYSPSAEIEVLANSRGHTVANGKLTLIAMGQGQEPVAEAVLDKYTEEGGWVFLDNVHLMQGWIPTLERKLEVAAESAHEDFRCFFSAEPIASAPLAKIIPESILQTCIKIANEPPSDMKSNMRRAISMFDQSYLDSSSTPEKQTVKRSVLFALCFYHSLLLGRKKFGVGIGAGNGSGLGFCRPYSFNAGDLKSCCDVLHNYTENNDVTPFEDLRYLFGEVFYGGHITDPMDRVLCTTYLDLLIRPELLPQGDKPPTLELAPGLKAPNAPDLAGLRDYIETALPMETPALYGLHSNAELSLLTSQGDGLFKTILEVSGGGGASGGSSSGSGGDGVRAAVESMQDRLPEEFNMVEIESRVKDKTPYVVIALQEATRMNALLAELQRSLEELVLGLDGALNMSDSMEALQTAIKLNRVPASWGAVMSTRFEEVFSLSQWYEDVLKRHVQLAAWTQGEVVKPVSVCLPLLFNPKAFITSVMQTYARANKLPLDAMKFITDVTTKQPGQLQEPAPDGAYIHGLWLEGARWDVKVGVLKDSLPKEIRQAMPVMQIKPVTSEKYNTKPYYITPCYTNMQRANVYSPVVSLAFTLKTKVDPSKWTLASVALLLQNEDA